MSGAAAKVGAEFKSFRRIPVVGSVGGGAAAEGLAIGREHHSFLGDTETH